MIACGFPSKLGAVFLVGIVLPEASSYSALLESYHPFGINPLIPRI